MVFLDFNTLFAEFATFSGVSGINDSELPITKSTKKSCRFRTVLSMNLFDGNRLTMRLFADTGRRRVL